MTPARLARYEATLAGLERKERLRTLMARDGADFSSNDYLGFAGSTRLAMAVHAALQRGVPVGAGGSRLLRGNHPEHEALEAEAAAFFGAERVLIFRQRLCRQRGSFFNPAAARRSHRARRAGACQCARGHKASRAQAVPAAHNDVGAFEEAIVRWRSDGGTAATRGSPSKASIRWMAIARHSPNLQHLPNGMTAFW